MDAIISFFRSLFRTIFGGKPESDPQPADLPFDDTLSDSPTTTSEAEPELEPEDKEPDPEGAEVPEAPLVPVDQEGPFLYESDPNPDVMMVDLVRTSSGKYDTLGKLYIQGEEYAYTLEDEYREQVVAGETRIPAGTYELAFRKEGGRHPTYMYRFPDMHKGMLWITGVPDFPYALICIGNRESDTEGSVLVGTQAVNEADTENRREIWYSEQAYRRLYPVIAKHLAENKPVKLRVH